MRERERQPVHIAAGGCRDDLDIPGILSAPPAKDTKAQSIPSRAKRFQLTR